MARERMSLVSEDALKHEQKQWEIEEGLLTNEVYNTLPPEEQTNVKRVLFEMFSEPVVAPEALSGLEFAVFGLAKLFFKMNSGTPLTAEEQAFYDRFGQFVGQHEITMDAGDWYVPYAEQKMLKAKENRARYKELKTIITGTF